MIEKKNDWKKRLGILYSTNPDFKYETISVKEAETLPKTQQKLRITLDKRNRAGKIVTIVSGFKGSISDLTALGKLLKTKCSVGGSIKDGEIIIQGDLRDKVKDILTKEGYYNTK